MTTTQNLPAVGTTITFTGHDGQPFTGTVIKSDTLLGAVAIDADGNLDYTEGATS